jgi:hypothetical protein
MKKVKCTTKLELADKLEQQKATKQKDPSIYVSSQVGKLVKISFSLPK